MIPVFGIMLCTWAGTVCGVARAPHSQPHRRASYGRPPRPRCRHPWRAQRQSARTGSAAAPGRRWRSFRMGKLSRRHPHLPNLFEHALKSGFRGEAHGSKSVQERQPNLAFPRLGRFIRLMAGSGSCRFRKHVKRLPEGRVGSLQNLGLSYPPRIFVFSTILRQASKSDLTTLSSSSGAPPIGSKHCFNNAS